MSSSGGMFIFVDEERFPISILDTMESVHLRIASNIDSLLNVPLFPDLIILKRVNVLAPKITETVSVCKRQEVVNELESEQEYELSDFYTGVVSGLLAGKKDKKTAESIADTLISTFKIKDREQLGHYIVFFCFESSYNNMNPAQQLLFEQLFGNETSFTLSFGSVQSILQSMLDKQLEVANQMKQVFDAYKTNVELDEDILTTPLRKTKTWTTLEASSKLDLFELFNDLIPTTTIPFVGVGNFYKVLNTFKPPAEWPGEKWKPELEAMILYISSRSANEEYLSTQSLIVGEAKDYTRVEIKQVDGTTLQINLEIDLVDEVKDVDIITKLFKFMPAVSDCRIIDNKATVDYLLPLNDYFYIPLLYDAIMNDVVMSSVMLIDESIVTFRQRGGVFLKMRYNQAMGFVFPVRINLGQFQPIDRLRDPDMLFRKHDEPFISVELKAVNDRESRKLQLIISQLINYFLTIQDELKKQYLLAVSAGELKLLSEQAKTIKKTVKSRGEKLKDIAPDMFVTDYPRSFQHEPSILETKEEVDEAVANGQDVMCFPLDGSRPSLVFVCDNEKKFKYVGLRKNNLPNRNKFPVLPICLESKKDDKPRKDNLRDIYEDQYREKFIKLQDQGLLPKTGGSAKDMDSLGLCTLARVAASKDLLDNDINLRLDQRTSSRHSIGICSGSFVTTNKKLHPLACGLLPANVQRMLLTIDPKAFPVNLEKMPWIRQGCLRSKNCVLDAIIRTINAYYSSFAKIRAANWKQSQLEYKELIANGNSVLKSVFDYDDLDDAEKQSLLSEVRAEMVPYAVANVSAQSSSDIENIKNYILNKDLYLDICIVWRILEEMFHIKLFVFQRTTSTPNGKFIAPKYLQQYLEYQPKTDPAFTLILYENNGGEFERLEYPQIEMVMNVDYSIKSPIPVAWIKPSIVTTRLQECFDEMYNYKTFSKLFKTAPTAQSADIYGKIRFIQFDDLCIMTDPLAALNYNDLAPTGEEPVFKPTTIDAMKRFVTNEGIPVDAIKPVVVDAMLVGVQCSKSNFNFYIPLVPSDANSASLADGISPVAPTFINTTSKMSRFVMLDRQARYLIQHVIWMFSKWHATHKGDVFDQSYIKAFATSAFTDPIVGHTYPYLIPRLLDSQLPNVYDASGKFIVPSISIRNKLIYGLLNNIRYNTETVETYKSRIYIKDYYQQITDFKIDNMYVLLQGTNQVQDWTRSRMPNLILHDTIDHFQTAYFIQLPLLPRQLGKQTYLFQRATTIGNALYIASKWNSDGFNPAPTEQTLDSMTTSYVYVAYNSNTNYTVLEVGKPSKLIILQYKYKGEIYTGTLLSTTSK